MLLFLRYTLTMKTFFLIFYIFLSLSSFNKESFASSLLVIYRDMGHTGDQNQAHGVVRAYKHFVKHTTTQEFDVGQENQLSLFVQNNTHKKPIVLGLGEKTVSSFSKLLPLENTTTIHLCHMVTVYHEDLLKKVALVAVPKHALETPLANILKSFPEKIIKTNGVAHNRNAKEIDQRYLAAPELIPKHAFYLAVILGGDAPTPENNIRLFTATQARTLAQYVAKVHHKRHVLITNGPRTGKYDPSTFEEIKTAHRTGEKDFITQAFIDELIKGDVSAEHFTLFDFQFNSVSDHMMDILFGAIRATSSEILLPAESTSLISEAIDVLSSNSTIVYETTSMNKIHKAHIGIEFKEGRIRLLSKDFNKLSEILNKGENLLTSNAAEKIASKLFETSKKLFS